MTKKNKSRSSGRKRHSNQAIKARTTAKDDKDLSQCEKNKIGRWEKWEHKAFLEGLKIHGKGNWKLISTMIPTR
jgi:hypothetical protein